MLEDHRVQLSKSIELDPVLDFQYIMEDLGVSKSTFFRSIRPTLPVVEISDRLRGVRQSDYSVWKGARVRAPRRAA